MAGLWDDATLVDITRPGQTKGDSDIMSQRIVEFAGSVEASLERRSVLAPMIPKRSVQGTDTIQNFAVGEVSLSKVTPGVAPAATKGEFNKATLKIDTLVVARNAIPILEDFQTQYSARQLLADEHGKEIAKFTDQAFFIQAAKVAQMTTSKFGGANAPTGHKGGDVVTLDSANDVTDPSLLYAAIKELGTLKEEKDVDPIQDGLMLALRPREYNTLYEADQIINRDYITSDGNTLSGIPHFKALGIPVVSSNNIPKTNISGHLLSNTGNGNAYDGNFTKLVGVMLSARALLAGETIPLTSDVWYDKLFKTWFVDSHLSFGVTGNRAEFAGAILLP